MKKLLLISVLSVSILTACGEEAKQEDHTESAAIKGGLPAKKVGQVLSKLEARQLAAKFHASYQDGRSEINMIVLPARQMVELLKAHYPDSSFPDFEANEILIAVLGELDGYLTWILFPAKFNGDVNCQSKDDFKDMKKYDMLPVKLNAGQQHKIYGIWDRFSILDSDRDSAVAAFFNCKDYATNYEFEPCSGYLPKAIELIGKSITCEEAGFIASNFNEYHKRFKSSQVNTIVFPIAQIIELLNEIDPSKQITLTPEHSMVFIGLMGELFDNYELVLFPAKLNKTNPNCEERLSLANYSRIEKIGTADAPIFETWTRIGRERNAKTNVIARFFGNSSVNELIQSVCTPK